MSKECFRKDNVLIPRFDNVVILHKIEFLDLQINQSISNYCDSVIIILKFTSI